MFQFANGILQYSCASLPARDRKLPLGACPNVRHFRRLTRPKTLQQIRRNPDTFFDTADYLRNNPDVVAAGINPLDHFLRSGIAAGRSAHRDLF